MQQRASSRRGGASFDARVSADEVGVLMRALHQGMVAQGDAAAGQGERRARLEEGGAPGPGVGALLMQPPPSAP